jgi:squalene-hopene/tetraprenyl-beta-curcumene cyclase
MSVAPRVNVAPAADLPPPIDAALADVCRHVVEQMHGDGFWEGRLSSSALSTATAVSALAVAGENNDGPRIHMGVAWLRDHQNPDGGWGDTSDSPSNLATTLLAVAAMRLAGVTPADGVLEKATLYLAVCGADCRSAAADGGQSLVAAIARAYGEDRTFAVPILMNCALAGLVSWQSIPPLPFELAILPHGFYRVLRLHVVSYALPALIAIGVPIDHHHPPKSFLRRTMRKLVTPRVLAKLSQIQPPHGGFLEAAPLTSFVAMALTPLASRGDAVVARALEFLRGSQRDDGSWPIDTNLSVWLTTAAVSALAEANLLRHIDRARTIGWLRAAQYKSRHPYTHAAAGGWSWTHLPGGVPDVDDTSGALLAMRALGSDEGVAEGLRWLVQLQNGDGGWPTFCLGWGKLPFDRSAPDLTAHALRAIVREAQFAPSSVTERAIRRGVQYLKQSQQSDGSWTPLWFGNQAAPAQANPVLGTSRVLRAWETLDREGPEAARGVGYLVAAQNADGGWGGAAAVPSSQEETAMAVAALAPWAHDGPTRVAVARGVEYLLARSRDTEERTAPIGLYFAHLWYAEQLYPPLWTLDALGRVARMTAAGPTPSRDGT